MARIGSFTGETTRFGVPPNTIHPIDNNITPDPAQAAADALAAEAQDVLDALLNAQRDPNAGNATATP